MRERNPIFLFVESGSDLIPCEGVLVGDTDGAGGGEGSDHRFSEGVGEIVPVIVDGDGTAGGDVALEQLRWMIGDVVDPFPCGLRVLCMCTDDAGLQMQRCCFGKGSNVDGVEEEMVFVFSGEIDPCRYLAAGGEFGEGEDASFVGIRRKKLMSSVRKVVFVPIESVGLLFRGDGCGRSL